MIRPVSRISSICYKYLTRPILFKISPDTVHTHLLKIGSLTQRSNMIRQLLTRSWAYQNPSILGQTIHHISFPGPVGLSAGFDKNFILPPLMKTIGFNFMEGGSITLQACSGNPKPWFYRLPKSKSLVVHVGLANEGVEAIMKRLQEYPRKQLEGFAINISVAKTNSPKTVSDGEAITDYVGCLQEIRRSGQGDMITINISCPNTFGGEPFTTPARLERLLSAIDTLHMPQPLFIKMPCSLTWSNFNVLLRVIAKHHIDGLTIGNLMKDHTKTVSGEHIPPYIKGGLSGRPTWEATNELIRRTYLTYGERFVIIGVGGIFSAEDAYKKIKLGANLVELITGMIYEGPQLIGQINYGLEQLLKRDGYTHISQAVGVDATL